MKKRATVKRKRRTKKEMRDDFDAKWAAYEKEAERRSAWGAYVNYCNQKNGNYNGMIYIG